MNLHIFIHITGKHVHFFRFEAKNIEKNVEHRTTMKFNENNNLKSLRFPLSKYLYNNGLSYKFMCFKFINAKQMFR